MCTLFDGQKISRCLLPKHKLNQLSVNCCQEQFYLKFVIMSGKKSNRMKCYKIKWNEIETLICKEKILNHLEQRLWLWWSTCGLVCFTWLFNHFIYLKLKRNNWYWIPKNSFKINGHGWKKFHLSDKNCHLVNFLSLYQQ